MKKEYIVEQVAESRWLYTFTEPNEKGETIIIELSKNEDCCLKDSLLKLWIQSGCIDKDLETYWSIQTYVKDTEGKSFERYNPQHKREDGKSVINCDWIFEATEENKEKLINEVYRLASAAKGE